MKIHLQIDDAYPGDDCYWFPFSTPSASSDGSGWYCMPEVGDHVRVYFPSKKTGDVIAISAVNDRLAEEEAPKDWVREDAGAIPVKRGKKKGKAVEAFTMGNSIALGRAAAGNIQKIEPVAMRTMEMARKIEPVKMRTMEMAGKIESVKIQTMEPAKLEVSFHKAVTTAVTFGQAREIKTAAMFFDKGAVKR